MQNTCSNHPHACIPDCNLPFSIQILTTLTVSRTILPLPCEYLLLLRDLSVSRIENHILNKVEESNLQIVIQIHIRVPQSLLKTWNGSRHAVNTSNTEYFCAKKNSVYFDNTAKQQLEFILGSCFSSVRINKILYKS